MINPDIFSYFMIRFIRKLFIISSSAILIGWSFLPKLFSIVRHASTQCRTPAPNEERQHPMQNASTQRHGQPALTDI